MTVWPSGLRRWLKAPFRKGVGSNPTAVILLKLASADGKFVLTMAKVDRKKLAVFQSGLKLSVIRLMSHYWARRCPY